ncbi:MAG: hypothetical protein ACHQ9S_27535 [Candidatus Binatia bacterium]
MMTAVGEATQNVAFPVKDLEVLEADVGVVSLGESEEELARYCHPMYWSLRDLVALDDVRTWGYAYGIQTVAKEQVTMQRAFKGYVVSRPIGYTPVGYDAAPFEVYELSFQVPRGLSGAPLQPVNRPLVVHGVIIGNSQSRMKVFSHQELVVESGVTNRVEHFEALTLGLAVRPGSILDQTSRVLRGTIRGHLDSLGLLRQPPY